MSTNLATAQNDYLCDFLRENGVFVLKKQRVSIAGELAKTTNVEAQHKWTYDKIAEVLIKDELFNSHYHPEYRSVRSLLFHFCTFLLKGSPSGQLLASMMPNMSQVQTTEPISTSLFAPQVQKTRSNPAEYLLTESQISPPTSQHYLQLPQQLEERYRILKTTIKKLIFPNKKSQLLHINTHIFPNVFHHILRTFLDHNRKFLSIKQQLFELSVE
ncbi:hypothetical protein OnM2_021120 [Erysiphe neolycopersici]|uniref:Uncharacterized protein n=1 Tax=Erysiphe neolycopersici TaxID=212602 RepID=A0A420I2U1_9PEZI|nr:hypothetical protein OnM2_021120 [Erysiphe neolycopersici]